MPIHQDLPGLERRRPREERVAADHQLVEFPGFCIFQHALERSGVPMDVGNTEKAHGALISRLVGARAPAPGPPRLFWLWRNPPSVLARRVGADFTDRGGELVKLLAATRAARVASSLATSGRSTDQRSQDLRAAFVAVLASARQQAHARGAAEREAQIVSDGQGRGYLARAAQALERDLGARLQLGAAQHQLVQQIGA